MRDRFGVDEDDERLIDDLVRRRRDSVGRRLLSTYGMSGEHYEALAELQNWVCAICEEMDERVSEKGTEHLLSVDHDHETGRVRALLCHRCNTAIGLLRDDPKIVDRVAEYLRLHGRR